MKIMSLNVNQFRVLRLSQGCWAKDIVAFVKKFLCEDINNVVFLYEVPYYAGASGQFYHILELFEDFCEEFPNHSYMKNYSADRAYFCTLAITNKGSGWEAVDAVCRFGVKDEEEKDIFKNRFVELVYKDGGAEALRVLGVHAPLKDPFLETLTDYIKKVTEEKRCSRFMVLGDLNCHRKESSSHRRCLNKMEQYLCDLIEDKTITYFPGGTTVDHVLISQGLKGSVTAQAIPKVALELSDHAVVIVNIEE